VADNGVSSSVTMWQLHAVGILWISRVPETMAEAKAALARVDVNWQTTAAGEIAWRSQEVSLAHTQERWVIARTHSGEHRARAPLKRKAAASFSCSETLSRSWRCLPSVALSSILVLVGTHSLVPGGPRCHR
jgi:transposase